MASQSRVDQGQGRQHFSEEFPHDGVHGGCEDEHDALMEREVAGRIRFAISRRKFVSL